MVTPAAITESTPAELALSGAWTACGLGAIGGQLEAVAVPASSTLVVDAARIEAFDTAGAWVLQKLLRRLRGGTGGVLIHDLRPEFTRLLEAVDPKTL